MPAGLFLGRKNGYDTGTQVKSRGKIMTFKLLLNDQDEILQHLEDEGITVREFCNRTSGVVRRFWNLLSGCNLPYSLLPAPCSLKPVTKVPHPIKNRCKGFYLRSLFDCAENPRTYQSFPGGTEPGHRRASKSPKPRHVKGEH
jgi:hypothetical protein